MKHRITDIDTTDAYYTKRDELIGKTGELLKIIGPKNANYKFCQFKLDSGRLIIFRKVKLEKV